MVKAIRKKIKKARDIEQLSINLTNWIGTPQSIIIHTLLFAGIFLLSLFGFGIDQILLILTTAVSLEAIYLAIFIQMTVNRNTKSLEEVEADIEEIQEDVEDLEEDLEEITEDMEEDDNFDKQTKKTLQLMIRKLQKLQEDIDNYKTR